MYNLAILLIVLVNLISLSLIQSAIQCNNESLVSMDIAMSKGLNVGRFHRKFPEVEGEVRKFCDEEEIYIREVEEYKNKCMKNLPKQLTSISIYSIRKMIKSLCRGPSKRLKRLMSGAPCANKAHHEYARCHNKYIDALQGTFYEKDDKRKIPLVCCEFYKYYDCMRETAPKYDICTEDKIEANIEYVGDIFNEMTRFLCGDWTEDSDKCSKLSPPVKKRKSDRRTYSFIVPFTNVLESFPEI